MAGVKCSAAIPFELVAAEQMLLMQCSIEWGDPYTHTGWAGRWWWWWVHYTSYLCNSCAGVTDEMRGDQEEDGEKHKGYNLENIYFWVRKSKKGVILIFFLLLMKYWTV